MIAGTKLYDAPGAKLFSKKRLVAENYRLQRAVLENEVEVLKSKYSQNLK